MSELDTEELLSIKRDLELAIGRSIISISASEVEGETIVTVKLNFNRVSKPLPEFVHDHRVRFEHITPAGYN